MIVYIDMIDEKQILYYNKIYSKQIWSKIYPKISCELNVQRWRETSNPSSTPIHIGNIQSHE